MNFLLHMLVLCILTANLQAKVVLDTDNKPVTVPDKVSRVFGSSPPMNYLIYAIDPNKMIGLNFDAKNGNNQAT